MLRVLSSVLVLLAVGGCASSRGGTAADEAVPPVRDLAGTYTFTTLYQGTTIEGQMRITGSPGDWAGSIWSDLTGDLPLTSVSVDGPEVLLTSDTPDGPVDIRLVFDGDAFTGAWSLGAEGGALEGRRVVQ